MTTLNTYFLKSLGPMSTLNYGTLTRLSTTGNNVGDMPLRDSQVEGFYHSIPEVGENFTILAAPKIEGAVGRLVRTSVILGVFHTPEGYTFKTMNSEYTLKVLTPEPEQE
jgi:hypothetical protein